MNGDAGGDRQAAALGFGDHFDRARTRKQVEVGARAAGFNQGEVAGHADRLGRFGYGRQPKPGADRAFMHHPIALQPRVSRGDEYRQPVGRCVLHRAAHHQRVFHRLHAVAQADAAGVHQQSHIGQPLPAKISGQCAERMNPGETACGRAILDHPCHGRRVDDRKGVGRAYHSG